MIWEVDQPERTLDGVDASGKADPAYASALGLLPAPLGRRSLAFVVDLAILGLLQLPFWLGSVPLLLKLATGTISLYGLVNHPDFVVAAIIAAVSVALLLIFSIVQWILHGRRGVTIGKAVAGIRTVNVRTLERPGVGAVLLRFLIVSASGIIPVFGSTAMLLSPTFDPERRGRGLHDRATRVWLVDVRRGLQPYDEKRMRIARKQVKAEPLPERAARPSLATRTDAAPQPDYRPGQRISAGVLGVGRSGDGTAASDAPSSGSGLTGTPPATPAPAPAGPAPVSGIPGLIQSAPDFGPASGLAAPAPAPRPAQTPAPAPRPAQTPVTPPAAAPAAAPVARVEQPVPVERQRATSPEARVQETITGVGFGLRLDTGDTVVVSEPVLVGRDPDGDAYPGARTTRLRDEDRSLSKTHALLRPVDGGIEVVDWRSTNGSAVIRGGQEHTLDAGAAATAALGDSIRLGDRVGEVIRV
ncbi:RDD family protein [Microbacterium dauci]|uniref:RDD family protein n=1 Tax=Microbacterium dauci TaxID=3048008 RepID=A0ABT6ZA17_9MICO|nr:RDD family protein [Microbacterium sp. LX3-4]MDJ1112831.1 RDD family protein [Microbacterium sp. LX3-4]